MAYLFLVLCFGSLQDIYGDSVSWFIPTCLLQYVDISSPGFWAGEDHGNCTPFVHNTAIGTKQCCFPYSHCTVGSVQPFLPLHISYEWVCHRLLRNSLLYDSHRDKFEWSSDQKVRLLVKLFWYIYNLLCLIWIPLM